MSSALALSRKPVPTLVVVLTLIVLGTPTALAAADPAPTRFAAVSTHDSPPAQNSHGFDPYYRDPTPIASPHPATPADDPSTSSIAISAGVTLLLLTSIAAHVRWTRFRRRRVGRAAA